MKMTITEKILARAANRSSVSPGDNIWVNADILLTHDVCGPGAIGVFQREFGADARVWDTDRVVIMPDHYIDTADEKAHRNVDILRDFVRDQGLPHFYDPGTPSYCGVCHVGLPQKGHVRPGEVIFGTDSHTCAHGALGAFATGIGNTDAGFVMGVGKLLLKTPPTQRYIFEGEMPPYLSAKDLILHTIGKIGVDGATYQAMEFAGETVSALSIEERMTLCNMAIEAGAKNGIVAADAKAVDWVRSRTDRAFEPVESDTGAPVLAEHRFDVSAMEPCVAQPHLPSNVVPARDCSDVKLDRVYIGSCTGGKIEDFTMAARLLLGRTVSVETCLVPATVEVAEGLLTTSIEGRSLIQIFSDAGCLDVAPPSCAACLGGPIDTFGRARGNDVVLSTTNRNFIGRMGSKDARIYLASPFTAAASAVTGHITDPRTLLA